MSPAPRIAAGVTRGPRVRFAFEGRAIEAHAGESVAAALLAAGVRALRRAPVDGGPRGAFCLVGICQECLVEIDGRRVEACRAEAREGLDVRPVAAGDGDAV
jgi:predicted molibdopterin-dependent oxidoreductase YjgC